MKEKRNKMLQRNYLYILSTLVILLFNVFNTKAQSYSINTSGAIPDSSAMLDIISSNKGLLIPRVSLISTTDSATIVHPAVSLQVYNTNASMTGGKIGFWYWSGTRWIKSIAASGSDSLAVNASVSTPLLIGGSTTTSSLTYKTTTANGTTGADHIFKVGNNGATEAMRIVNNGNVGIGTNDPQRQLHINSDTPIIAFSESDAGTNAKNWSLYANSETFVLSTRADNWNHSDYALSVQRSGNVGMGLASPDIYGIGVSTYKLLTLSAPTAGANFALLTLAGGTTGGGSINMGNQTVRHAAIRTWSGSHLAFYTNSANSGTSLTEKMRIDSIGRVGVGTTTPTALIHGIKTTEQLRLGYDASNYYSTTVGSTGAVTFDATGSGAAFTFSDAVSLANNSTASTQALNDSTTKIATTAFVDRAVAGASGGSTITNDASTNATMYPVWVTANTGSLPLKVSSTKLSFNPSTGKLTATGDATINTLTVGLGASAVSTNTAFGYQVLNANTSGSNNVAQGYQALYSNTTASNNMANGYKALYTNTTGATNTATGTEALYSNTTASNNLANGYRALYSNTTGTFNTAIGTQALYSNTTASNNTATGYKALYSNTTGTLNTANGTEALYSATTGNFNSAFGYRALYSNTTASNNTANGYRALYTNTTGSENTAVGTEALNSNTTGIRNTATGYYALYSNTTGYSNVAVGMSTLLSNTTGYYNIGIGLEALYSNSTGNSNISIGQGSSTYNTTGVSNSVMGTNALRDNSTGSYNTGAGAYALRYTTASYNTAVGYNALGSNSTGTYNSSLGYTAGSSNTTGTYNVFIGYNAQPNANNYTNSTAIGNGASVSASNKIRLGDANVTVIEGQVAFTNVSDGRFKKNIKESDIKGLEFIMKLRPVSYNIDTRQYEEFVTKNLPDSTKIKHFAEKDFTKSTAMIHNGFVAQEVEVAAQQVGYEFSGLHKPETEDDNYGLAYSEFVVPLVKAMQEQQQQITAKDAKITVLENKLEALTNRIQQLELKKQD